MAENNSGDIYKSSGGFIPGDGQNTWYGVPKEYYDQYVQSTDTNFINYNKGTSQVDSPSVVLDAKDNTWKLSNESPKYTCNSSGWGEVYAAAPNEITDFFGNLTPEKNPTTTAARRSLAHSLMSVLANSDFYMFMLIKGFVYKNTPEYVDDPPKAWLDAIAKNVVDKFDIPSYPDTKELAFDEKIVNAFGKEDIVPDGEYYKLEVLKPDQHPSYGTKYDPYSDKDVALQGIQADQQDLGYVEDKLFQPQNKLNQKPDYVSNWSALWKKDDVIGEPGEFILTSVLAPVYESEVVVDGQKFLNFLQAIGLVEFNVSECINRLQNMLIPAPVIDETTGQTQQGLAIINIPGASNGTRLVIPNVSLDLSFEDKLLLDNINATLETPESPKFNIGTIHPGATHYVNNRIPFILSTDSVDSEVKTEYAKYQQNNKAIILLAPSYGQEQNIATKVEYGDTVKVTDEYTTFTEGKFHRIEIIDPNNPLFQSKQPLYIKADLLNKLPQTLPSLNRIYKKYSKSMKKTDWHQMEDEEIFFDNYYLAYSVVVEPLDPATNKKISSLKDDNCSVKVQDLEAQAIRTGIEVLMNCYNKSYFVQQNKEKTLDHLVNGVFQFAYSKDGASANWYLDPRPNSKLKMIVRVPAKYFDGLQNKVEKFDNIPTFTTQGVSSQYRVTSLLTCNIAHKINMATSIMRKYQTQIEDWEGTVDVLDIDLEISRLNTFAAALEKFVNDNGYTYDPDGEDEIEIGCDNKFRIQYVNYVRAGFAKPLRFCFNRFRKKEPVRYPRTMAYIYYLDRIVELERRLTTSTSQFNQINWVQFVQKYTYPMPKIRPSSRKKESPIAPSFLKDGNQSKAKKLQLKFDRDIELTSLGKLSLDKELSLPKLKLDIANARQDEVDFSGDLFIGSIPNIIDLIRGLPTNFNGLQDLFSLVFDKIDIGTLSSIGAGSLAINMTNFDIQTAFSFAALDSPDFGSSDLGKITGFLSDVTIGKINLAEGFLNGSIDIGSLEGEFPEDILQRILELFEIRLLEGKNEPDGRHKQIMENAPLEDIKCLGLDKKYAFVDSPKLTKKENNKKELIKLIADAQELIEAVQKAIPQILDAMSGIGDLGSQDLPSLSLTNNVAVKMPKPPTFSLPSLKTDDTMPGITQDLNKTLEEILATILIETVAALLESVFNEVFSGSARLGTIGNDSVEITYGGEQINDLLGQAGLTVVDQLFNELGFEYTEGDKQPQEVISDVSNILTPFEVLDLLEGTPNKETLKVVEAIITEDNKKLADSIAERSSVREVFKTLGGLVDPRRLQEIRNLSNLILPNASGLLCEDEKNSGIPMSPADIVREKALADKLDPECIQTQMTEIREQRIKNLSDLLGIANGKDILAGKIPSPIDNCGPNAKQSNESLSFPTAGIINKNHQTIDYLNDKVIKAVFDPIKINFSLEANGISDTYLEQTREKVSQYDEQYDALKPTLRNAGLEDTDDFIEKGFAGELGEGTQNQFDTAVAPLLTYSKKVAPKIKNTYGKKVAKLAELGRNKNIRFVLNADKYEESPQAAAANIAKQNLDNAIAQLRSLQEQEEIAKSGNNPSLAANIDNITKQISDLTDQIGVRSDQSSADGLFGAYNELLKATNPENPNDIGLAFVTKKQYNFSLDHIDYNSNIPNFQIKDDWKITVPKSTAENLISFPKTSKNFYVLTGTLDLDPDIIIEEADKYTYFDGDDVRDQIFSNYARHRWGKLVPITYTNDTPDAETGESGFYNYYRNKRPRLFASMTNIMSAQLVNSKAFDLSNFEDIELGSGIADLNLEVQKECEPKQQDNLLGLEDLKKKARQEYDKACDDNQDSSKSGSLEKANLRGLMKAAMRLAILDTIVRGLFLVSKFSIKKMFEDEALTNFIISVVKSDLYRQERDYYDQFLIESKDFIDERKKNGEKFVDPFTGKEKDVSTEELALEFLIRENMKYLIGEVEKKIKPDYTNIDLFFLDNVVPSLDVGFHKDENRFQKLLFGDIGDNTYPIDAKLKSQFGFIDPENGIYEGSGFFVLERYLRVEDNDFDLENANLNEAEKAFLYYWYGRVGGKNNLDADALPSQAIDDGDLGSSESEGKFGYTSGAVNVQAFLNALKKTLGYTVSSIGTAGIEQVDMSKILKLFKFGLRLVYISPSEEYGYITSETGNLVVGEGADNEKTLINLIKFEEDKVAQIRNEKIEIDFGEFDRIYNNDILANQKGAKETIIDKARKEKLYSITENVATIQNTTNTYYNEKTQEYYNEVTQTRKLYPVPMVVVEEDYGVFDIIANEQGIVTITSLQNFLQDENSQKKLDQIYSGLKQKMIQSKEYRFLFHYDLPLYRMLSMIYIHHNVAAIKHYPNIKDTFLITKNLVKSNFFNMIPGDPWWSKQDKSIEEQGGNAGMAERDNNTMTSGGPSGLAVAGKIAVKASIILTKAMAAQQDPHYGTMKFLDDFGLAPFGMTWGSVPVLYPVNFPLPVPPFVGWGPPMTPLGMIAYSLPLLPGEIKQKKERQKNKEKNDCTNDNE